MKDEGKASYRVVLIKHGHTLWDQEERIEGWENSGLSHEGHQEAAAVGELLKAEGFEFDICFTSVLKRTVQTWNLIADALDQNHVPVLKHWRLNGKHLGALQGKKVKDVIQQYGQKQIEEALKGYNSLPPPQNFMASVRDKKFSKVMPLMEPLHEVNLIIFRHIVPKAGRRKSHSLFSRLNRPRDNEEEESRYSGTRSFVKSADEALQRP